MIIVKNKKIIIGILVVATILVSGLWILIDQIYQQVQEGVIATKTTDLKEACLNATIRGIELDIEKHQKWLEMGTEPREEIESRLNKLRAELEKYKGAQLQDYEIPEKREVIGWVNQPCTENTILQIENMTKSGPFYHIVGIKGEDYTVIKPKTKYRMTIYLVYPRYYPFSSYYIYIDSWEQIPSTIIEISKEEALKLANQALEKECNLNFSQIERIKWTEGPDIENLKKEICQTIDKYSENEIWRGKISLNENIEIIALVGIYGKFVCLYGLDKRAVPGIISVDKACEQEGRVTVTTDKTEYEQGEMVKITVKSDSGEVCYSEYRGSDCWKLPFGVEKFIEDERRWKNIRIGKSVMCPQWMAPPATKCSPSPVIFMWDQQEMNDGQVPPGKYRIKFRRVYSNEFTIKEKVTCDWCGRTCVRYPINKGDCEKAGGIFLKQCACPEVVPPEDLICVEENGKCVQKSKVEGGPPISGGPCSYDEFRGKCKITSIFNENKIRFEFTPTEPLNLENIGWVQNKEDITNREYEEYAGYLGLKCLDKYPITEEDLERCGIKENAVFDCEIELITKGTCTPIVFKFYE
ncbi:hypothetical protein J7K24_01995 [bacterium]|nr:hypothetical protein [bacterium]